MMTEEQSRSGPHQGQPILVAGEQLEGDPLEQTHVAMILLHGRGATAASMLELAAQWNQPDFTYLAPQAVGNSWYPHGFLAPLASNEPFLSSALTQVEEVLERIAQAGIPPEHTMLFGFSQGACLALEFAARHARRYGGVVGLSGGLIGPDDTPRDYAGSLAGTPSFWDVVTSIPRSPRSGCAFLAKSSGA
jgi:predicted esterase